LFQGKHSISVDRLLSGQDGVRHRVNINVFGFYFNYLW